MKQPKYETFRIRAHRLFAIGAAAIALGLLGADSPADAASLQTYFGIDQGTGTPPTAPVNSLAARNAFLGEFSGTGVEDFESQSLNAFPSSLSFPSTSITAGATTTDSSNNYVTNGTAFGTFATSGSQYLFQTGSGAIDDTLTFSSPVAGVGMYVTDLSDGVSPPDQIELLLTLTGGSQSVETSVGDDNNNANLLFFGVESTDPAELISSVEILNTVPDEGDAIGIDDITIGTAINAPATPEPSTVFLLGAGFIALLALSIHRRRSAAAAPR